MLVGDPSSGYSYKCTVSALATIIETDIADGYVTISTTQTISGAKTFSNNLALTSVSNANTDTDKFLVLNASNVVNFRTGAEVLSDIGGQGALTLTTTGSSGASTLVGNTLNIPTYTLSGLGGISGSGSTGYLPKFTGTTSIGNSIVQDNGSTLNIAGGIICNAISASSLTSDQYIAFQNINTSYSLSGYTLLYATLTNPGFIFNYGDGTRSAIFRYAAGSYTYTLPSATGTLALTSDITSSISGTANYIPKFTGSSSIGNSVIYESSSNIGIGTTAPSARLHILANNALNEGVAASIIRQGGSAGNNGLLVDVTNTVGQYVADFRIANSSVMRLDASGNLGLGVTPSAWGSGYIAQQIGTRTALISGTLGQTFIGNNNYNNGTNWLYLQTAATSLYEQYAGSHAWYNAPSGTAGNAISFTQAMTLDASGNLSIGNTSASGKVHITGGSSGADLLFLNTSGATTKYAFKITGAATDYFTLRRNHPTGGDLDIMSWTYGGNVGIGNTAPINQLDLNNTGAPTLFDAGLKANQNGGEIELKYIAAGQSGGRTGSHIFYTGTTVGGSERMRITSGGSLLLGTTTDKTTTIGASGTGQTIGGSGTTNLAIWNTGNADWVYSIAVGNDGTVYNYNKGNTPMLFSTNGSERMRITSGGNVGIGTTSPLFRFSVQSSGTGANTFSAIFSDNSTNGNSLGISNATGVSTIYSTYLGTGVNSDLAFQTTTSAGTQTEKMRITSGGNVLVGTTTTAMNNQNGVVITPTSLGAYSNSGNGLLIAGAMRGTVAANIGGQINFQAIYRNSDDDYTDIAYIKGLRENATDNNWSSYISFETTSSTTTSERMRITSGGEVYIAGTTDQGAYNLQVNGTGVWGAGAYVNGSDRSLKENIYDLDGCLELVKQLKPVTYKYKESYSKDTSTQTGFIAQDLKELFKDKSYLNGLVKEGGQHLSVAYQNLIPLLVKAIQEQQAEIEILKNK
jgi:hypothetical protein